MADRWHIRTPHGLSRFLIILAAVPFSFVPFRLAHSEIITTIDNSAGLIEVIDVNTHGSMLLRRELDIGGALQMTPRARVGRDEFGIRIPERFTNAEGLAISDTGVIAGYSMRAGKHPDGNQRAVVWAGAKFEPEVLPVPEGFRGASGHDISRDGKVVSGIAVGRNPPRLAPCLWQKTAKVWEATILATPFAFNPLLTTAHVVISGDGKTAAGSVVIDVDRHGLKRYGVFFWRRDARGDWIPELALDRSVHLTDLNDHGVGVGRVSHKRRSRAFVFGPGVRPTILPLPKGHVSSMATGINKRGDVVGYSEDPPGPEGTVRAFLWRNGQLQPLPVPADAVASMANCITEDGRVGGMVTTKENRSRGFVLQLDK